MMGNKLPSKDSELALPQSYFADNINVGLEDITADDLPTPTLTVTQANSKMRDDEGRPFIPGKLYYKPTRKLADHVTVSILVASKTEMPRYADKTQLERVYVLIGALTPDMMPFKMFLRGWGAGRARQFLGEVKAARQPMYALSVVIGTEKKENDFGEFYVPVFQILGINPDPTEIVTLEGLARTYSEKRSTIVEHAAKEEQVTEEEVNPETVPF